MQTTRQPLSAQQILADEVSLSHALSLPAITRRQVLIGGVASACVLAVGLAPARVARGAERASANRNGRLVLPQGIESLATRSKIVLELSGELRIEDPDPKKQGELRRAEVQGKSTLDYLEIIGYANDLPASANRRYVTAETENRISGNASSLKLRPECRDTGVLEHDGVWESFCAAQPLDAREVELLRSPINTLALEWLLPAEPAKASEPWTIGKEAARHVFNLEAVHSSTLTARVSKVEKGVATISLEGELEATASSVATKLKVTGSFQAQLGRQCAYVNWVGLSIREEREISQSLPGFAITARISLLRAELKPNETQGLTAELPAEDAGRWLVRLQSQAGRFSLLADRNWQMYVDGGEEAILRMIENNTVIAQCNVTQLPKMDAGTQLTLEAFQEEIKKSLGENLISFGEATEKLTSSQLRLLRIVVHGQMKDVPIQWIFCHLSDDSGRRIALEYTFGGNLADRFAAADEQMTSSFEFLTQAESVAPTPAPAANSQRSARENSKSENRNSRR